MKQLFFGGIFLAVIVGLVWGAYRLLVRAPTCTDNVQNQGEEGVDCGAVCEKSCPAPIRSLENFPVRIVHYANGTYDAVARLENPNATYGASRVDYTLKVAGASDTVTKRTGRTYVNPLEPHYLVFPLSLPEPPTSISLQFISSEVQWGALNPDQAGRVQLTIRREILTPTPSSFRYEATVTNRSNFDFDQVDVTVLLSDGSGALVGSGTTIIKTLIAGQERAFVIDWPFAIAGAVRAQTFVTTNLFDNANYIRAYGSQERFQGY